MTVLLFLMLHLFSFLLRRVWGEKEGNCSLAVQVKCKGSATFAKKNIFKQLFSICEVIEYDNIFHFSLLVKQLHSSIDCKSAWNNFCWLYPKSAFLEQNLEGLNEYCAVNNSCLQTGIKPVNPLNLSLISATGSITTESSYFCCNPLFFVR